MRQTLAEYYHAILPDPQGFAEVSQRPLPTCIWTNTLKITPAQLQKLMAQDGFTLTPIVWHPEAFRCLAAPMSLGKTWQYLSGLFQIQEEVSMLPPVLLAPRQDEKVLDLCAAPGNKTAQLAVMMQNQGTVIANDRNYGRMRAMGQIMKRLSLMNISTSIYDGVTYPALSSYFDKVLVDAPCSCEGTFRKGKDKTVLPHRERSLKMGAVQLGLLKKAVQLTRAGGRIVYSTCTFAPEENERVISELLKALPEQVRIVPIKLDAFEFSPGVTAWQNETYHPDVMQTMRVWPHFNDTGGFYVAVLEKTRDVSAKPVMPHKMFQHEQAVIDQCKKTLQERYHLVESLWSNYQLITDSNRGIYITDKNNQVPHSLKLDASGLFFFKNKIKFPKLTTSAAMLMAPFAKKHVVELTQEQMHAYYQQEEIVLSDQQVAACDETGYVIVNYQTYSLGSGLYFTKTADKPARLYSLFPKYLAGVSGLVL